jgi:heme/copper-type cytochrome/quinol oxidase subunit 2
MDYNSIQGQKDLGISQDYAMFWAGVWNEKSGWSYLGQQADSAADRGVMPVVQWWYWGDDISKSCVTNGCWSSLHGAHKSRAKWAEDAGKLADTLHSGLKGRKGVLVLESEFNKGDIATWETFDGYLAEHAKIFRQRAPELTLVLGFGNWGSQYWKNFDRAVGAVDMVGFQTMRGSTKDSYDKYATAVGSIKDASAKLKATFGKPVLLHDLALSSYGSGYEGHQEKVVKELFSRMGELKAAGLEGIVYRSLGDNPKMNTANYYGMAERYMGFKRADASSKPALNDWVAGIKAERGGSTPAPAPSPSPSPGTFAATFTPKGMGNDWWVEVKVDANQAVQSVAAKVGSGEWTSLPKTSWGAWAKSLHAPDGSKVQFRATSTGGAQVVSATYTWDANAPAPAPAPAPGAFSATFTPKGMGNDWWVEVKVDANEPLRSVAVKIGNGAWTSLPKTSWGAWAKSLHAPDESKVQFRATAFDYEQVYSTTYTW